MLYSRQHSASPEQQLWCAVIFQVINDATRLPGLAARAAIKGVDPDGTFQVDLQAARHAVVWLSRPSEDLLTVCDLAGCDMDAVVARGEELLIANKLISLGVIAINY